MNRAHPWLAIAWALLVLLALVTVLALAGQRALIRTDIRGFLPDLRAQQPIQAAVDQYADTNSRQLVVLLTGNDAMQLVQAADQLNSLLEKSGDWSLSPLGQGLADAGAIWQWYQPFAGALLSADDRLQLQQQRYQDFLQDVVLGYVNPMALSAGLISQDPLLLLQDFLAAGSSSAISVRPLGNWSVLQGDAGVAVVAVFVTGDEIFDLTRNARLAQTVFAARATLARQYPQVEMNVTGAALHVFHSVRQSEAEMSVVGLGSLLAILVLFFWLFRSPVPLLASVLVLASGLVVAFACMVALFESVHLITLVFCSTVMGMGIDYALHYFVHHRHDESALQTLRRIVVPTGLGMLTSALAFLALTLVPFPGFRQLGFMAALGLASVWISMLLWFPYLPWRGRVLTPLGKRLLRQLQAWRAALPRTVPVLLLIMLPLLLLAALQLKPDDDIRQLQARFPALQATEQQLQHWLGLRVETAYFMVTGPDQEAVLGAMETLCERLRGAVPAVLLQARCVSDWWPSQFRQDDNQRLVLALAQQGDEVWTGMRELGLPDSLLQSYRRQLAQPSQQLTADAFWQGPMAGQFQPLWQAGSSGPAAVVPVAGVLDRAALAHLAVGIPGVYWVDQVQQFSDLFGHFRQQSALYVFASYALLLVLLGFRYGISGALQILWPVLVATLTVLALAGITGTPFNLFSVLALILVAGMGIDYGIFLRESAVVPAETLLAVIMSALTTLLAFGLLALSKTTAISSFGWVIVTGISVVLACAVLTLPSTTQQAGQE